MFLSYEEIKDKNWFYHILNANMNKKLSKQVRFSTNVKVRTQFFM